MKKSSLYIGSVIVALVITLIGAGSASAAVARGWTPVASDWATWADTPSFSLCLKGQTLTTVTLKVRAVRPTSAAIGIAAVWNTKPDYSGVGGSVNAYTWAANVAVVPVKIKRGAYLALSWTTNGTGYAYTSARQLPTGLKRCL